MSFSTEEIIQVVLWLLSIAGLWFKLNHRVESLEREVDELKKKVQHLAVEAVSNKEQVLSVRMEIKEVFHALKNSIDTMQVSHRHTNEALLEIKNIISKKA